MDLHRGPSVAVIVAHPDDETLWAGGAILLHPEWRCSIVTLCRGDDVDRSRKFERVTERLGTEAAVMGRLDDGPEQEPLLPAEVEDALLALVVEVGPTAFDLILTHSPHGEYSRHRRHEEVARAVIELLRRGSLSCGELRLFAYEDDGRRRYPCAIPLAPLQLLLPEEIWRQKVEIMSELYGFGPESWEVRATPLVEAFWTFADPETAALAFGLSGGED